MSQIRSRRAVRFRFSFWWTPPHGDHSLDDCNAQAQTFLRTLTAMRPHAWTKYFVAALLVFLAASALVWASQVAAQSQNSPQAATPKSDSPSPPPAESTGLQLPPLLLLPLPPPATAFAWTPTAAAPTKKSPFSRLQPTVSLLTPTDGVDFREYIATFAARITRNWYAIMPERALRGEKGIVVLTLQVEPDGTISAAPLRLERASGKQEFDNAAMSAIVASAPFEALPAAFSRPNIELRVLFAYNAAVPRYPTNPENFGPPPRFRLLDPPTP